MELRSAPLKERLKARLRHAVGFFELRSELNTIRSKLDNFDDIIGQISDLRVEISALQLSEPQSAIDIETKISHIGQQIALLQARQLQTHQFDLLHQRAVAARSCYSDKPKAVAPPSPHSLQDVIAELGHRAPLNFAAWQRLFKAAEIAYAARSPADLSVESHREAFLFRQMIAVYARGRILDLGVGPLPTPAYLFDFSPEQLAGLDPLAPFETHPFAFAHTVAERIPWPDGSFETLVAATSLDHVYLLDVALDEAARVLTPGGRFLVWTGMFPETAPYDPYQAVIQPIDQFHLFHPGENWFPAYLERWFRPLERLDVGPNNVILALERRT